MAKDPALLFYTSDFLSSTQGLTLEEIGMLIKLLCVQHQNGHLTKKTIKLAVGEASEDVMSFFKLDENGLYYNERLDGEKKRRADYSESRRKNRLNKSANKEHSKSYDNTYDTTYVKHMETETETETVTETKTKTKTETETKTDTVTNINKGLYGALNNVKLSEGEYETIRARFPKNYKRYIDDLSYYIKSKGDKYKSHYATILQWNRDKDEETSSFDTDDFFEAAVKRSAEIFKMGANNSEK